MSRAAMPVAASFLERLLFNSAAIEAVSTLSSIWQLRADPDVRQFGLSLAEYRVQLCLIYTGEVGNGGHSQFFLNRPWRLVSDTIDALLTTGLPELAATLRSAVALFPIEHLPDDQDEAERALDALSADDLETLSKLDRRAFKLLPAVDNQLLSYLRENRSQVLLPETPPGVRNGQSIG